MIFQNRQGFTGQQGFVSFQVHGIKQSKIGRNSVTDFNVDDITWNNMLGWDGCVITVSGDSGSRGTQTSQRAHGLFSLELLKETNENIKKHDKPDNTTRYPISNGKGDDHTDNQDQDHGIEDLVRQDFSVGDLVSITQVVWAVRLESTFSFVIVQTVNCAGVELLCRLLDGQSVCLEARGFRAARGGFGVGFLLHRSV
jgi:hypothetical protein